ncbi:MAG: efflux RND transporter periplasmic adaptor subunit [Acidobacteria bacterium]|nr:efflux RND transporter periplasmic adaptor subunit [Acidobacteriota bacterium]
MESQAGGKRSPGRSGRVVVAGLVIVVALGALAWAGIANRARAMVTLTRETNELAVPTVSVIQPKRGAPQDELVLPGTVQAFRDAPIYARTGGYLKSRHVELGTRVAANQLLAEIDAPELEQQLQQARADLATAEANARLAQTVAERNQDLAKTDSVSRQDLDNALGTLEARKTAVESARHNVDRLVQLKGYLRIYAPFDGVITARNTDVGALIDSGASGGVARELFHLASTDRLRVFVNVPESYARATKRGLTAELTLAELPGRRFTATLARTAESIDVASRTLLTEFEVPNPRQELLPGAYAEVHIALPTPASALILPVNALMFGSDGVRVGVVREGGVVAILPVTLGRDFGTDAEVASGLSGDEWVVLNPPDSLAGGQIVRVLKPARPAVPKPAGAAR